MAQEIMMLTVMATALSTGVLAQWPGDLDTSFSTDGKVTTDFSSDADRIYSVTTQPDGKIVVAGMSLILFVPPFLDIDFAVARYNADGTLDTSFDTDGKLTTDFAAGVDWGTSVAIQPDGKIVVAGSSDGDFALAGYNTDGTLDNSFDTDGKLTTDFAVDLDWVYSVAVQSDGRIVVAGWSENGSDSADFALARYNTVGSLDHSFSTDGRLTTDFGTDDDYAYSLAIQPDGKIVVAGRSYNGTDDDFAVARYISGLNVGVIDLRMQTSVALIYPNPITETALLEYELTQPETISIQLLDMQGKLVHTFVDKQQRAIGKHSEQLAIPESMSSGTYLLNIKSDLGNVAVQIVKN